MSDTDFQVFVYHKNDHVTGDRDCGGCWDGFPKPCKCGGLVHNEFFDDTHDGVVGIYQCDLCGEDCEIE